MQKKKKKKGSVEQPLRPKAALAPRKELEARFCSHSHMLLSSNQCHAAFIAIYEVRMTMAGIVWTVLCTFEGNVI